MAGDLGDRPGDDAKDVAHGEGLVGLAGVVVHTRQANEGGILRPIPEVLAQVEAGGAGGTQLTHLRGGLPSGSANATLREHGAIVEVEDMRGGDAARERLPGGQAATILAVAIVEGEGVDARSRFAAHRLDHREGVDAQPQRHKELANGKEVGARGHNRHPHRPQEPPAPGAMRHVGGNGVEADQEREHPQLRHVAHIAHRLGGLEEGGEQDGRQQPRHRTAPREAQRQEREAHHNAEARPQAAHLVEVEDGPEGLAPQLPLVVAVGEILGEIGVDQAPNVAHLGRVVILQVEVRRHRRQGLGLGKGVFGVERAAVVGPVG